MRTGVIARYVETAAALPATNSSAIITTTTMPATGIFFRKSVFLTSRIYIFYFRILH